MTRSTTTLRLRRGAPFPRLAAVALTSLAILIAGMPSGSTQPVATDASAARDVRAPTKPTRLKAVPTAKGVTVTWAAASDNVGVAHYRVSVGGKVRKPTATRAVVGNLTPSTAYLVRVSAVDRAGNVSATASLQIRTLAASDTEAPSQPTDPVATPAVDGARLAWSPATDNVAVKNYVVSVAGQTLRPTGTSVQVSGLLAKTSYTAGLQAMDAAGNLSATTSLTFTTLSSPAIDTEAPSAPTDLRASAGTTTVSLSWAASTDDIAVTGYTVVVGGRTSRVTGTSATVADLSPGTAYIATVAAGDAAGNTSTPATVEFRTTATAGGTAIYVSPTGSDSAAGTASAPLRSIQLAVDRATPGTTIRLYAGTYNNAQTIKIRTSGTASAPITIAPVGDGEVKVTHPVTPMACSNSRPAPDRTFNLGNGVDHWTIQGLSIHNGIWMNGKRSNDAYNWLTNHVKALNWEARRTAPGHGTKDPAAARTQLVPFLRSVTGSPDLDMNEGIVIRDNHLTGRGIYGALASYGEISGNTIDQIPCGIGPGIWLMTFSSGWLIKGNDISDIAISTAAHFMQEGIRVGSAANYNEITGNYVHDLPGDGRGINTDVDGSWNYIHHNQVRNVAIGYNDQMSGWGNRWEYNSVDNYRTYGIGFRLMDAPLTRPSLASSSHKSIVRCNITSNPVGKAKAVGIGAMTEGSFSHNRFPLIWLGKNLRSYWSAHANTWDGSSDVPSTTPADTSGSC